MVLVDTNVWLALVFERHPNHVVVRNWFKSLLSKQACFCRATQQSFLRLLSTRSITELYQSPPLTNAKAWQIYQDFQNDQRTQWAAEPAKLEAHWQKLSARKTSSPKIWMDAYLAAFAIASGMQFITTDGGFRQFQNLDVQFL